MANIKYGAPVDEVAGALGGVVFQRNASSKIVRLRTKPRVTWTVPRMGATTTFSTFSWYWYDQLTAAERTAWDVAAAATTWVNTLGQNYSPTGQNAFIRSQIQALEAGYTWNVQAPAVLTEADPVLTFAYANPDLIRVAGWGAAGAPPNGRVTLWTSLGQRPTRNTWNGPWTFAARANLNALPGVPWTFEHIQNPHPDQNVFIKYRVFIVENPAPNPPWERGRVSLEHTGMVQCPAFP